MVYYIIFAITFYGNMCYNFCNSALLCHCRPAKLSAYTSMSNLNPTAEIAKNRMELLKSGIITLVWAN